MRVIAGTARSIPLIAPNELVRPTTDRTKETLFNMISNRIPGANVLDLFAGSGALGIECLSRGAYHCDFIDSYEGSIDIIKKNLAKTKLIEKADVFKYDYTVACNQLAKQKKEYQMIFLDPPYHHGYEIEALHLIARYELLSKVGILVIETALETTLELEDFPWLTLYKVKTFKTNKFTFLTRGDV